MELNGSSFSNTHGFQVGNEQRAVTPAEVAPLIAEPFLDNTGVIFTDPVDSFIWRVLEFQRLMMPSIVRFTRLLVTDRRNYQAGPDNVKAFKSYALNFTGARTDATAQTIENGNIILSLVRRGTGVGAEDGELELRNVLNKEDTRNLGRNQLDWSADQARLKYSLLLTDALAVSGLENHFIGGELVGGIAYAIPRYASEARNEPFPGSIIGGVSCEAMSINGPRARQVRGGKKKKKETN
jgi:hypothetical protein